MIKVMGEYPGGPQSLFGRGGKYMGSSYGGGDSPARISQWAVSYNAQSNQSHLVFVTNIFK